MGTFNVVQGKELDNIYLSMKDLWTLDLEEKYIINPELIEMIGIRIVIWDIEKLGKKRIITKAYTARTNPFYEKLDIKRLANRPSSFLLEFKDEKELSRRCKTIQVNCSRNRGEKIDINNPNLLIKDLIELNKNQFDTFNLLYKKEYHTSVDFPLDHLLIHRSYDDFGNIYCSLVAFIENDSSDDSSNDFEIFNNDLFIDLDDEERLNKYFKKTKIPTYCCIAKYVDSVEIFNLKEPVKFKSLNNYLESGYGYKKDPLSDDQNEFASLLKYKLDYGFMASFKPGKSVFEYQLIGYDKESKSILGPIYTSSTLN